MVTKLLRSRAAAACVLGALLATLAPIVASAANYTYANDIPVTLTGSGIGLIIVAGSTSDTLDIQATTITVSVAAAEAFTLRFPGPNPGRMPNDGGLPDCNLVNGNNDVLVSGPKTVTFTPNLTACVAPSGGGSGSVSSPITVTLGRPNGGESLHAGDTYQILWQHGGGSESHSIRLQLSTDGGNSYPTLIAQNEFDDGLYVWTVPNLNSANARIRVQAVAQGDVVRAFDVSDANFSLIGTTPPPTTPPPQTPAEKEAALKAAYDPAEETMDAISINSDKELIATQQPHPGCPIGGLVKLPSDNNPLTQMDSSIYYCGADGHRHVFPDPKTFFTWYTNFSNLTIVSADVMASIPLGRLITYRPGVKMIKIVSDPKVYAVGHNGTLRWVPDEATARVLYGAAWAMQVQDVSDAFFFSYMVGDPLPSVL